MPRPIAGVLPVLQTPFDAGDQIDRRSLQREIDWALEAGADGVCTGMVSEILRFTVEERLALNSMMSEMTAGRGAVVASVGAESTRQAVSLATAAVECGCDAVMAISPVTTALPERELWGYFVALAEQVDVPLIVQDASSYVGRPITASFCVRLIDSLGPEKILFKPEGSPVGPFISELRAASNGRARVFDGSGGIYLIDAFRRGVIGTMPGVDLLDGIVAVWHALRTGNEETAYRIALPLSAIVALQLQAGLDGFLAIEKHILVKRGLFPSDRRREPNSWWLDAETEAEVDRLLERLIEALNSVEPA